MNEIDLTRYQPTIIDRFWSKVDKSGECWVWMAGKDSSGYGRFKLNYSERIAAHRFIDLVLNGPMESGTCVLHRCDNPACVRPDHLFRGTHTDNMRDMARKGRTGSHPGEKNPKAKLTPTQVQAIRQRHAHGEIMADLAREYGVDHGTISKIVKRRTWKDAV